MTDEKIIPYSTLINFSGVILVTGVTLVLMIYGKPVIRPMVVALVITFLITAISESVEKIQLFGRRMPAWLARTIAILFFAFIFTSLIRTSGNTVRQLIADQESVVENINILLNSSPRWALSLLPQEAQIGRGSYDASVLFSIGLEFLSTLSRDYIGQAASMLGQSLIVIVYVIFMLIEQRTFAEKVSGMYSDPESNRTVMRIIKSIGDMVHTYFSVKTVVSLMVGGASFVVMLAFGLDNAFFWAVLIFLLNYIPYLGSVTAVIFPVAFSLVQFGDWGVFLAMATILYAIQIFSGSFVEPTLAGRSLNISPLVVFASLTTFGTIWGVVGMILAVPITIIIIITFSHFEATRPIAIVLSGRGQLTTLEPEVMIKRRRPPAHIYAEDRG